MAKKNDVISWEVYFEESPVLGRVAMRMAACAEETT
jgi:hypothetical protein